MSTTPRIQLTAAAKRAIERAKDVADGPRLRLEIEEDYSHRLFFDEPRADDLEVESTGVVMVLDPGSAARADGVSIDFVDKDGAQGFKVENPNGKGKEEAPSMPATPRKLPEIIPEVTLTDAAFEQFTAAIEAEEAEEAGKRYGILVTAKRMGENRAEYELGVLADDERKNAAIEAVVRGIPFWMDARSARNLDSATIDFVDGPSGAGFKFKNPKIEAGWDDPMAARFQKLLDDEINPGLAAHGGNVELLDIEGDTAFVLMGGGCQGCGAAAVTLQQGIKERVRTAMPEIQHIIDTTDHAAGENPYYQGY